MIIGYHIVFTAYGFWLPNDPRGSRSRFVGATALYGAAGPARRAATGRSVARVSHDRVARIKAKTQLKYPAVELSGAQALVAAAAIGSVAQAAGVAVWACAVLPSHVHLVISGNTRPKVFAQSCQDEADAALALADDHPLVRHATPEGIPTAWAKKCWKTFLYEPADVYGAINYVNNNPVKEGRRRQRWSFVVAYAG